MIRIVTREEAGGQTLLVAGHLRRDDVAVLEEACAGVVGQCRLNFEELRGIDDTGVLAVRRLIERGALVFAASAYIRLRLALEPLADLDDPTGNAGER